MQQKDFFPDWYNNGICVVGDVLDFEDLKNEYSSNFNILNYYTVIRRYQKGNNLFCLEKPVAPLHVQTISHVRPGCKTLYKHFVNHTTEEPLTVKGYGHPFKVVTPLIIIWRQVEINL